jgi:hypothetical protein
MARIKRFIEGKSQTDRLHPTIVDCEWNAVRAPEGTFLQLNTFGSNERAFPHKLSQTLQVDRAAAGELKRILTAVFPGI